MQTNKKTLMKSYLLTWLFSLIYVIINKILNIKISNSWDEHQISSLGLIILFLYQNKKKNFVWVSIAFIKIIVHMRIYSLDLLITYFLVLFLNLRLLKSFSAINYWWCHANIHYYKEGFMFRVQFMVKNSMQIQCIKPGMWLCGLEAILLTSGKQYIFLEKIVHTG